MALPPPPLAATSPEPPPMMDFTIPPPPPPPPPPPKRERRTCADKKRRADFSDEEEEDSSSESESESDHHHHHPPSAPAPTRALPWSAEEDALLIQLVGEHGGKRWKFLSGFFTSPPRTHTQCLHRWSKVLNPEIKKGPWTAEEDAVLKAKCLEFGDKRKWTKIAQFLPGRIGKQIRERWEHQLRPGIDKDRPWSLEEDREVLTFFYHYSGGWADLARRLPGRTDNSVKNHFHSSLKKCLEQALQDSDGLSSKEELIDAAMRIREHRAAARLARASSSPSSSPSPKRGKKIKKAHKKQKRVAVVTTVTTVAHPPAPRPPKVVEEKQMEAAQALTALYKDAFFSPLGVGGGLLF